MRGSSEPPYSAPVRQTKKVIRTTALDMVLDIWKQDRATSDELSRHLQQDLIRLVEGETEAQP